MADVRVTQKHKASYGSRCTHTSHIGTDSEKRSSEANQSTFATAGTTGRKTGVQWIQSAAENIILRIDSLSSVSRIPPTQHLPRTHHHCLGNIGLAVEYSTLPQKNINNRRVPVRFVVEECDQANRRTDALNLNIILDADGHAMQWPQGLAAFTTSVEIFRPLQSFVEEGFGAAIDLRLIRPMPAKHCPWG